MTTLRSIQAIVFDCFGVLYEDALKEFIEHYATESSPHPRQYYYELALATDRGHLSDHDFYAELSLLSGQKPTAIQHRLRDAHTLNRGVVSIIQALRPRYKLGLLSNAERHFLDRFLAQHQLNHYFDAIVASSETAYVKPERGIYDELARRLGLQLPQIVFIDDSPVNTSAAAQYGMIAITYSSPSDLGEQLARLIEPSSL